MPIEIETTVPLLDRGLGSGVLTEKERENSIREFQQRLREYPTERLQAITRNKRDYSPAAIKAAKKVMKERGE